jgi:hypothetical protein
MTPAKKADEKAADEKAAEKQAADEKVDQQQQADDEQDGEQQEEAQTYAQAHPDEPRDPSQAIPEVALPTYLGGRIGEDAASNPQL